MQFDSLEILHPLKDTIVINNRRSFQEISFARAKRVTGKLIKIQNRVIKKN